MKNIDGLVEAVHGKSSVEDGLEALAKGIAGHIRDLKSSGTDPETAARIDALATQIEGNVTNLVAAVQQNTAAVDQPKAAATGSQQAPAPTPPGETKEPESDAGTDHQDGDGQS